MNVNVEKEDINGNHRLTSKKISFNDAGVKLSLSLNKKPIKLKKYDIWSI